MALQQNQAASTQSGAIAWATSWDRTRADRNDDWHGFAAVSATDLVILQPKETKQPARGLQVQVHGAISKAAATGRSMTDFSNLDQLIRRTGKTITIPRGDIVAIQALAKGNLIRISTTTDTHVLAGFLHKSEVTRVAKQLAAILTPNAEPQAVPRPKLTADLLRPLAVAPATVAFFFMLAIGVRVAIDDRSRAVTRSGRFRLVEETLGAIPIPVLGAVALMTVATLIVRITFRARDEVRWSI